MSAGWEAALYCHGSSVVLLLLPSSIQTPSSGLPPAAAAHVTPHSALWLHFPSFSPTPKRIAQQHTRRRPQNSPTSLLHTAPSTAAAPPPSQQHFTPAIP